MNALEELGYDLDDMEEIRDSCIPWEDNFDEVAFQVLGHGGWGYSSASHVKPDSGTPESVLAARYAHFYISKNFQIQHSRDLENSLRVGIRGP